MTLYKFGGIVLVLFLQPDGQRKKRPALVILDTGDDDVILAPVTTKERKGRGDYEFKDWQKANLLLPSWVRIAKISCVNKKEIAVCFGLSTLNDRNGIRIEWKQTYKF